ncbi:MAG: hypothetical protein IT324_33675 [Anaerolineae bacterium]|nr:hypothetical protein [Anaerolineae bacterium]
MNEPDREKTVVVRLLTLNQEAFAGGHYEAAYHILDAALHYAYDTGNSDQLRQIEQIAQQQLRHIDSNVPSHTMSSQSVMGRHGVNLFDVLAQQASVHARLIDDRKHRKERTILSDLL